MIILVSDTSVLIDLERGGLLEAAFSCGMTLVVPDLLYEKELEEENGPYLRSLGLGVSTLSPDELSAVQQLQKQKPGLSTPDCFALICATRPAHALVSGDKALRNEAKRRTVTVYGLLWLLDQMAATGVGAAHLFAGLSAISAHRGCRLPRDEVKARLAQWEPE